LKHVSINAILPPTEVKPEKLIIWGAAGHAMVVADIVRLSNRYEIAGYLDDLDGKRQGQPFCGSFVLGGREQLTSLRGGSIGSLFVAIGDCEARLTLADVARENGFKLATLFHPGAIVAADATVGEGSLVAAGAVLCPGVRIGQNVIINTAATVDHECAIEDGAHVSPGAHLAGKVRIGRATWVGLGANLKEGVHVGSHSIIGAGSLVLNDIPGGVVAYGTPARVVSGQPLEREEQRI
jgi:UDP-N-acetylbacillosamine N-acetyltransferase